MRAARLKHCVNGFLKANRAISLTFLVFSVAASQSALADPSTDAYRGPIAKIIAEATSSATAKEGWNRLAELADKYPARLSGSKNLEAAISWAAEEMKQDDLSNVRVEKVMVPHWIRGEESAEIVSPYPQRLAITALGGSVGGNVQAPVLVVKSYDELANRAADVKGKIVLYNTEYDESIEPLAAYRQGQQYRGNGASRAAALGAVGALLRSVGPTGYRTVHTGGMRYADNAPKIPIAAIAAEDAQILQRMQDRGVPIVVKLSLGAQTLPDAESGNIVGEIVGRNRPDEIVLIGAHLDSWDLASGAIDDGGGCVALWEALRVLQRLGLTPRRTIRLVLYTNEENGARGGIAYRDRYRDQLDKHVLAIEADTGALPIRGFSFTGTEKASNTISELFGMLAPLAGSTVVKGVDGTDIMPIVRAGNVPGLSPLTDMHRYFFLHHTPADTADKVLPSDLANLTAAMAAIAYTVADMPDPLDREPLATGR